MASPRRQPERQPARTTRRGDATGARLEELRDTAVQIIERTMVQPFQLNLPDAAAEGERIRNLYTPLFVDLQQRARSASTLEELDEVMARHARLADLLDQEVQYLAAREQSDEGR